MIPELQDLLWRYYIGPIVQDSGYNPVNTLTWAVLLGVSLLFLARAFQRTGLHLDGPFILDTIPFILAGSSLRVVEDASLVAPPLSYLLITPLVYFLVALIAVLCLAISLRLLGDRRLYIATGATWTVLNLGLLLPLGVIRPWILPLVLILGGGLTLIVRWSVGRRWSFLEDRLSLAILSAHMLDASSTFLGVDFLGYVEKHVVPTMLIESAGTAAVMYPLKLAVLLPVLYLLDRHPPEDRDLLALLSLALLVLGLAPAVRNSLRMALGI
ncbi:MAG: hypothetical protein A4E45_01645 [Methanosaeta sp. PtaB.Bin039]|nr:MAG: hypothetical protein A4E45_01645 [Methanosaeta sp. PtaB.Bin039]OPY46328.1 MAG: hypothetical protein A4E47_00626 [Methanosaeta sp. PtaU1.Bin028]HOT07574.1 DUF63 family protein [Methanotrichaceae archaeon]HQF17481.1 DUF63 family protein [Methanotrichaceae archaeon]HQI92003.1 DUF63 family protein [Methanotrichaceae archaeon]